MSCSRQLRCNADSQGLQSKGLQLIHALGRVDLWASPPREEMAVHILQLSHISLSLAPPNLIEALSVLEPLSYYTRYLLESTNTIIPTLQVPFISAQKTLACLALSFQARNERHTLASMFSQTPSFPIQALSSNPGHFHWNLSNLTVSDKNEVYLDASGEDLELSCLL